MINRIILCFCEDVTATSTAKILGLNWNAINFRNKTITVRHTVVPTKDENGKQFLSMRDNTKSKKSYRELPLLPEVETVLLAQREKQRAYKKLCGNGYCTDYEGYIFVNEVGELIKPDYVSTAFRKFLKAQDELVPIRFHDLRHSCGSLLYAKGIDIQRVKDWLGHSDIKTTERYIHADMASKDLPAQTISECLDMRY